ncbi:MAG TPA: cation transporter [Noviherbaspirillum sp.]|nr:cation transporter [Noviherbaspirillum sp.]
MSEHCCAHSCAPKGPPDSRFRRALWIALVVNATMFGVELVGGVESASTSLLADAVDFFADATNYGVALLVLSMAAVWRSRAALFKGLCMGAFGLFVMAKTAWSVSLGVVPEPVTMGAIGLLALCANLGVAVLLYAFRSGDANMRSVWLCTRNDAIGNIAVMLAAAGVFGSGSGWPDWIVAMLMGVLALKASWSVVRLAQEEMREHAAPAAAHHHQHP